MNETFGWVFLGITILGSLKIIRDFLVTQHFRKEVDQKLADKVTELNISLTKKVGRINELQKLASMGASPEAKDAILDLALLAERGANDHYSLRIIQETERSKEELEDRVKRWPFRVM